MSSGINEGNLQMHHIPTGVMYSQVTVEKPLKLTLQVSHPNDDAVDTVLKNIIKISQEGI